MSVAGEIESCSIAKCDANFAVRSGIDNVAEINRVANLPSLAQTRLNDDRSCVLNSDFAGEAFNLSDWRRRCLRTRCRRDKTTRNGRTGC
jgi:hypothetical protein